MFKTTKNTKGNKTQDEGVIPFYTKEAFPSQEKKNKDEDDDSVKVVEETLVSLKLKIDESKEETKMNTYSRKVKSISNFTTDSTERAMELLLVLREEILPQLNISNDFEKTETFHRYMSVVCVGAAARQWKKIKMNARRDILKPYTKCEEEADYLVETERIEDIIMGNKFHDWLEERKGATSDELGYMEATSGEELCKWLKEAYHYRVVDYLNKDIFGEDMHKVLDQQVEYIRNKIIKPFGVTVKESFQRIETLLSYLKLFPPATKKDEFPTLEAHKEHENFQIVERKQRQIYLNVLPEEAYQLKFTTDCEKDYTTMSDEEFLNAAMRFEKSDKLMRERKQALKKSKEKRKSDSTSRLNRKEESQNGSGKRRKIATKKNNKGVALYCAFCKNDGAPKYVYTNHDEDDCYKKNKSEKQLSGGSNGKSSYQKGAKKELRAINKKIKKLKAATKELRLAQGKGSKKYAKKVTFQSDESSESGDSGSESE